MTQSQYTDDLFVSEQVHERDVALADGRTYKFWFRELPASKFRAFQLAETSDDENKKISSMALLVSESVCEPDGTLAMTRERAAMLKPEVMNAVVARILEINNVRRRDEAKKD